MIKDFGSYVYTMFLEGNKQVKEIDFKVIADDFEGTFRATDLQFQDGACPTGHNPNTSEFMVPVTFGIDENYYMNTVSNPNKVGIQPRIFKNMTKRFFNIVGRGHETISIANVFHEDYRKELLVTGLDFKLIPKEDFDLLRISTADGTYIENRVYDDYEYGKQPLNYRYTKEFYFDGGNAGEEIELNASLFTAKLSGNKVPVQRKLFEFENGNSFVNNQTFLTAPNGSFRVRIEFYKKIKGIYQDSGIGYYGIVKFQQYEKGAKF
ncbi:hypothetical protein [uncultured Clostridium sp.]|uniref:hypothetical protein n=1 Tax=uncultured Clostridium sp. TaxID=59620 RepID=UPI0025DED443|nr:hypothetical protein [uncultured Clostridium sp.]